MNWNSSRKKKSFPFIQSSRRCQQTPKLVSSSSAASSSVMIVKDTHNNTASVGTFATVNEVNGNEKDEHNNKIDDNEVIVVAISAIQDSNVKNHLESLSSSSLSADDNHKFFTENQPRFRLAKGLSQVDKFIVNQHPHHQPQQSDNIIDHTDLHPNVDVGRGLNGINSSVGKRGNVLMNLPSDDNGSMDITGLKIKTSFKRPLSSDPANAARTASSKQRNSFSNMESFQQSMINQQFPDDDDDHISRQFHFQSYMASKASSTRSHHSSPTVYSMDPITCFNTPSNIVTTNIYHDTNIRISTSDHSNTRLSELRKWKNNSHQKSRSKEIEKISINSPDKYADFNCDGLSMAPMSVCPNNHPLNNDYIEEIIDDKHESKPNLKYPGTDMNRDSDRNDFQEKIIELREKEQLHCRNHDDDLSGYADPRNSNCSSFLGGSLLQLNQSNQDINILDVIINLQRSIDTLETRLESQKTEMIQLKTQIKELIHRKNFKLTNKNGNDDHDGQEQTLSSNVFKNQTNMNISDMNEKKLKTCFNDDKFSKNMPMKTMNTESIYSEIPHVPSLDHILHPMSLYTFSSSPELFFKPNAGYQNDPKPHAHSHLKNTNCNNIEFHPCSSDVFVPETEFENYRQDQDFEFEPYLDHTCFFR